MRLALALCLLGAPLTAETTFSVTDSYIMGAGRWSCEETLLTARSGDPGRTGQLIGWVLGVWSAATSERGRDFTDTVEQVGGQGIFEATLAECGAAAGSTPLYRVVYSMIENTNPPD